MKRLFRNLWRSRSSLTSSPELLISTPCAVCGHESFELLCSVSEVKAQLEYVRRFHRRRLCPNVHGVATEDTLADRSNFTQSSPTNIVMCTSCGCVCRNPHPDPQAVLSAYAGDHYDVHRLAGLFGAHLHLYRRKARWLHQWLSQEHEIRVLEVGSFVGCFLAAGQEYGWEMLGVDPGKEVNTFCRQKDLPVFEGTLAEVPVPEASVGCIAIWNTFDQLTDPHATLLAAFRLLRPGGILALRTPNGQCFRHVTRWMHNWPLPFKTWLRVALTWNNMFAFPYLHGYSLQTLDLLLSPYGFSRIGEQADVLPRLADNRTKRWAAQEERWLKLLWLLVVRLAPLPSADRLSFAPWIDVCYRRA